MLRYTINDCPFLTGLSWEELQKTLSESYEVVVISESSFSILSKIGTMAVYNKV